MNTEESSHSSVRKTNGQFVEIPQQMTSTSRSYIQNYAGFMGTTQGGQELITMIPIVQTLKGILLGNAPDQRTGATIRLNRFEVCFNISAGNQSTEINWQPFQYSNAEQTDLGLYMKNKLIDPRIRILAVSQRRKLEYLPGANSYPFYAYGTGPGQNIPPISAAGNSNSYMVQQLDARAYDTHYDDTKNLNNRSSEVPSLTVYQDFAINSEYEFEDDPNADLRYGDNDLHSKVPDIWLYAPKQPYTDNTCSLLFHCSVRVLYDCM